MDHELLALFLCWISKMQFKVFPFQCFVLFDQMQHAVADTEDRTQALLRVIAVKSRFRILVGSKPLSGSPVH